MPSAIKTPTWNLARFRYSATLLLAVMKLTRHTKVDYKPVDVELYKYRMKLFIGYSRDDKAWTYELWRNIRDELHHDAWIDRRLVPAQDWWGTICEEIENADVFLYVMTPKAVESIYCIGELNYALALNKPILPLMLKPCDYPSALNKRRVQFQKITDDLSMDRVLLRITMGLMAIQQQKYEPREVPRPDVPTPQQNPEHIFEVFALAEEAAAEGNMTLANQFFSQVIEADPEGLGVAAKERMDEITHEQDRARAYQNVIRLADNPVTLKGANAAWRSFKRIYGDYDPNNVAQLMKPKSAPTPNSAPATPPKRVQSTQVATPAKPTSLSLMPTPFDWVGIPGGHSTLKTSQVDVTLTIPTESYSIATYPVTNAQFRLFVEADGYATERWWTNQGWQQKQSENWTEPRYWQDSDWNSDTQPVVGVSWYEAVAFCLWLSDTTGEKIMLPTEAQWQYAAQGYDDRNYPWGNDWDCMHCNNSVEPCDSNLTTAVIKYKSVNKSPFGAVDMAGNVWEWCLTDYENKTNDINSDAPRRVLHGGSWNDLFTDFFHCFYRDGFVPLGRNYYWGFRVASFK